MGAINRVCAISACEDLLCIIKTIMTKYEWSAFMRKIESIFSQIFLTHAIGRLIIQSKLRGSLTFKLAVLVIFGNFNCYWLW